KKDYVQQIGIICMNLSSFELNQGASIGDKVEVIGLEGENTIKKLSENSDRIVYEILVGLDKSIRRELT
ncbi:MAG TPA: alanine racemase C-terminal domain-containing protein, partial [Candidatus Absconditabacterales bacterium]|nr:alanine racemase C-terminal domain-containing protein [Candidatus Absconditabacterales bacterium]